MAHVPAGFGIDTETPEERPTVQGAGRAPQRLVVGAGLLQATLRGAGSRGWDWTCAGTRANTPVMPPCLDHVLIYDPRHLERVLRAYLAHYLEERPHRGLGLAVPAGDRTPRVRGTTRTPVERRDVLGGLIHEYRSAA